MVEEEQPDKMASDMEVHMKQNEYECFNSKWEHSDLVGGAFQWWRH